MRPRPIGTSADLELEHAQLDADLNDRPAVVRCTSRAMTSPDSGSYGQPWIASSTSRRMACSRTAAEPELETIGDRRPPASFPHTIIIPGRILRSHR